MDIGRKRLAEDLPFQVEGAPDPRSLSFASEIYEFGPSAWSRSGVVNYQPRVIIGSHLSGKTAHAKWITELHGRASERSAERSYQCYMVGPTSRMDAQNWTSMRLAQEIKQTLKARDMSNLPSLIESSRSKGATRTVLIIDAADYLRDDVVRWILANLQQLIERPETCAVAKIQLILAGSFTLDTLAGYPDSEYPLPLEEIPEFAPDQQLRFISNRMESLGLKPLASALSLLWKYSEGDKFLTQSLCYLAQQEAKADAKARYFSETLVKRGRDRFLQAGSESGDFFQRLGEVCKVIGDTEGGGDLLKFLNEDIAWKDLSWEVRRTLFRAGVVSKTTDGCRPRAQIVRDAIESRLHRRSVVFDFAASWLRLEYLEKSAADDVTHIIEQATDAAVDNDLSWCYIGSGKVIGENLVNISMESPTGETFDAEWVVHLTPRLSLGNEVVLVAFCVLDKLGHEVIRVAVWRAVSQ